MYRLYLDEHGTDTLKRVHLDGHRYLSLTGVIMKISHARDYLTPELDKLKAEIFDQDPDAPICLHRSDIRACKGPFQPLNNAVVRADFDKRILKILSDCDYTVITVFIDKDWMQKQNHWGQGHPYHFLMEVMIEKYVQYLIRKCGVGDIMPEARGKNQDELLQREVDRCYSNGSRYVDASSFKANLKSKTLKFRTKSDNIAGLQLCDLIAHPSHYTVRQNLKHEVELGPFAEMVSEILVKQKYDRSHKGDVRGYGFKPIP